jgi:hypothetical protein
MMKKLITGSIFLLSLCSTLSADPLNGEKLLDKAIHGNCITSPDRVAMGHSQAEWTAFYQNNELEAEVAKVCQSKNPLKAFDEPYPKYKKFIYEYLMYHASDSGSIPRC